MKTKLQTSEAGSELVLLSWCETGTSKPEAAAEEAYAAIAEACGVRGSAPIQERVFGDLAAAPAIARGRARALRNLDAVERPARALRGGLARRPLPGWPEST